jgi:hypothetical protein
MNLVLRFLMRLLRAGQHHPSRFFRYFRYRHLLKDRHLTFAQMAAQRDAAAAIEAETVKALPASRNQSGNDD